MLSNDFAHIAVDPNLKFETKLAVLINTILSQREIFRNMNTSQIDSTILMLLRNASLETEKIVNFKDSGKPSSHTVNFSVLESLIKSKLPESLDYYFTTHGYPKDLTARNILTQGLQRLLATSDITQDDYLTLCAIVKHLPSLNIALNNCSLTSAILNLNLSNEKLGHLIKLCTQTPGFDYFFQNSDGSYFFEKYVNDIKTSPLRTKNIEERIAFVSYLIELDPIKAELLKHIKKLPEAEKTVFDKIVLAVDLEMNLGAKFDEKLIKI
jgi:hypothetical protein